MLAKAVNIMQKMRRTTRIVCSCALAMMLCFQAIAQKPWSPVGQVGFSDSTVTYTSLAKSKDGTLYIAYGDYSKGLKATVKKFDGTNWVTVGTEGFSAGWVALTTIAFDNDTPYVGFEEFVGGYRTTVMKYNGTAWVRVGNYGPSGGNAAFISLAIDHAGIPYFAHRKGVLKFDGTNWVVVGNIGIGTGNAYYISLDFDNNNTPYVAYSETNNGNKIKVEKFDGTQWVPVGSAGFSNAAADFVSIDINSSGIPYVAFCDHFAGKRPTVMKYDGTNWVTVGKPGISKTGAGFVSLALDAGGTPYVSYQDNHYSNKATVKKYDGTQWVTVGNTGFSAGGSEFNSMVLDSNGTPYIAYRDYANGVKATVMKYDCPYPQAKIDICAVLTDTVTGYNIVTWDGSSASYVDSYTVFREHWGIYNPLGRVAGNIYSFVDSTAYPAVKSYKYKLTLSDSCFRETYVDSSATHETIWLSFNYLFNGNASISWNRYQGRPDSFYLVRRSNNGGPFLAIDSFAISGLDTTYTDLAPPSGSNRYRVDMPLGNPCVVGGVSYDRITSNIITAWHTGITDVAGSHNMVLSPNPATNTLKIRATEDLVKIEVFSFTGQKIFNSTGYGEKESILDISSLSPGIYFLKANDVYKAPFVKR